MLHCAFISSLRSSMQSIACTESTLGSGGASCSTRTPRCTSDLCGDGSGPGVSHLQDTRHKHFYSPVQCSSDFSYKKTFCVYLEIPENVLRAPAKFVVRLCALVRVSQRCIGTSIAKMHVQDLPSILLRSLPSGATMCTQGVFPTGYICANCCPPSES